MGLSGIVATLRLEGGSNGDVFKYFIEQSRRAFPREYRNVGSFPRAPLDVHVLMGGVSGSKYIFL